MKIIWIIILLLLFLYCLIRLLFFRHKGEHKLSIILLIGGIIFCIAAGACWNSNEAAPWLMCIGLIMSGIYANWSFSLSENGIVYYDYFGLKHIYPYTNVTCISKVNASQKYSDMEIIIKGGATIVLERGTLSREMEYELRQKVNEQRKKNGLPSLMENSAFKTTRIDANIDYSRNKRL